MEQFWTVWQVLEILFEKRALKSGNCKQFSTLQGSLSVTLGHSFCDNSFIFCQSGNLAQVSMVGSTSGQFEDTQASFTYLVTIFGGPQVWHLARVCSRAF